MMRKLLFFNRYTNSVEEEDVFGSMWFRLLYATPLGKFGLIFFIKRKIFSVFFGWLLSLTVSKKRIQPFIKKYRIKTDSFEKKIEDFTSFNDFFIRKLKPYARPISPKPDSIISPVDGRHLAYRNIRDIDSLFIKGEMITVSDLIGSHEIESKFRNGSLLISRLCPADYHRFHFPVDCIADKTFLLDGHYLSVHPFAMGERFEAFVGNKRMFTILHSEICGDILMIEIGATCVGSIKQTFTPGEKTLRGSEKGYFEFGGSTVISIFESGRIKLSEDVLRNSSNKIETYVLMGDEIATAMC